MNFPSGEDLEAAIRALGLYIGRLEQSGQKELEFLKFPYFRLRQFSRWQQNLSTEETQETVDALRLAPTDAHMFPEWLPCHNKQSRHLYQQCISPHDECHCARLQGCVLAAACGVSFEAPNTPAKPPAEGGSDSARS